VRQPRESAADRVFRTNLKGSSLVATQQKASQLKPDVFQATAARRGGRSSGPAAKPSKASKEVVADRSRNSPTFVRGANFETVVYPGSINYQDAKGHWQPIDDTLVPSSASGYAYQNKANSYSSAFPKSLADTPVHFAGPAGFVDVALVGAQGTVSASRNMATYANALLTLANRGWANWHRSLRGLGSRQSGPQRRADLLFTEGRRIV
jgi:hypothetical protein